jgi:hypothetical protein
MTLYERNVSGVDHRNIALRQFDKRNLRFNIDPAANPLAASIYPARILHLRRAPVHESFSPKPAETPPRFWRDAFACI